MAGGTVGWTARASERLGPPLTPTRRKLASSWLTLRDSSECVPVRSGVGVSPSHTLDYLCLAHCTFLCLVKGKLRCYAMAAQQLPRAQSETAWQVGNGCLFFLVSGSVNLGTHHGCCCQCC